MARLPEVLSRVSSGFDRLAHGMTRMAGIGYLVAGIFICLEVVGRNFFGISTQSTIEVSGYILAFGIAWGLGGALEARAHIRIDVLVQRMRAPIRRYLHALALAALAVFAGFLTYGAVILFEESYAFGATDISALATPLALPQGLWALGLAVFFAMVFVRLLRVLTLLPAGHISEIEALTGPRSYVEEVRETLEALPDSPAEEKGGQ